jgi:uncharacterized protein YchJ
MTKMSKLSMTIAFATVTFITGSRLQAQMSQSDQLFLNGYSSYQAGDCYGAVLWLFAYQQTNSPRMQNCSEFAKQVSNAWVYCDGEMKDTMFQKKQLQAQLNAAEQQIANYQQQIASSVGSSTGPAAISGPATKDEDS